MSWDPTPDEDMGAKDVIGGEVASPGVTTQVRANVAIFDLRAGEVGMLPDIAEVESCITTGLLTKLA